MSSDLKAVELLFQRPLEPVFTARDQGKSSFDLPESFYADRYSSDIVEVTNRVSSSMGMETRIPVQDLIQKPNLDFTNKLGRKDEFSLFSPIHKEIASQLIAMYIDAPDLKQFISLAAYTK